MHRRSTQMLACALLLLGATGCGEDGGANEATPAPAFAAEFEKSADALAAKLGKPGEKAQMPAADDPAVAAFDAQAAKAMTALGTPELPVDGFGTFESLCGRTAEIVGAYVGAGAGTGNAAGAEERKRMEANVERYLDQMFTPLLFAAHCSAAHLPFLEERIDPADTSKAAALQQVRSGAFAQAVSLIQLAAADDLDPARKGRIVDLLAQDAPSFAIALDKKQRAQVGRLADGLRARLPEDSRGQADRIKAGFENAPCGKLCAM